ncbi:preprotein translocase subunit SecY [Candidatus Peregrinibacteria bacterium]|nr:preprotein translocase subunit SecY [Candidatus Peregrinibacteria bacterium]
MFKYLLQIWNSVDLRKKILFTIAIIVIFRIATHITIPGIDKDALKVVLDQNKILGIFSLLTGGSAENFSIVLMGLSPYINASIIIQLLTVIIPRLESISKEGEQGRNKLNMYTRWITVPLAFLQSYGMILLLNSQSPVPIVENINSAKIIVPIMITITAGTIFLMWLGELISEKGIGNGVSLLIFAGIVANIPTIIGQTLAISQREAQRIIPFVALVIVTILLTILVVLITEAVRNIPITYATRSARGKGEQAVIPIRINQAGMIPIIFAVSVINFPLLAARLFSSNSHTKWIVDVSNFIIAHLQTDKPAYLIIYFALILGFSYFYVSITLNPEQVAENIQKRGGFIPGIRPGRQTAEYLGKISNRLTLFGGLFIAFIALAPILIQLVISGSSSGSVPLLISGAGMIIVVGVVLDLIRQVNAQLVMHHYEKFY